MENVIPDEIIITLMVDKPTPTPPDVYHEATAEEVSITGIFAYLIIIPLVSGIKILL